MAFDAKLAYANIKKSPTRYNEELHCTLILKIMAESGSYSRFCVDQLMSEDCFFRWVNKHEMFGYCYGIGKMIARQQWEDEGEELKNREYALGTISHDFEYWKVVGWSKFGVGKTSRLRLELNPDSSPNEHYAQLLRQASKGDFTAGEIKQLMEAVNVGLNAHQVLALQTQLDELKSDLTKMGENMNVQNTFANKGTA